MIAGPAVTETDLPLELFSRGKVRDTYVLGPDQLLMVATDRISAFDHVLPNGIPDRGKVLTQLSIYWFSQTHSFQENHLVSGMVPDLPGALNLDLEHHRDARAHAALELGAKRPVAPPGVVGVLDELSCGHAAVELVVAEEVVVDAVALSRTGTARGGRDRQLEAGNPLHQPADQRPLAHSGRPRDDEHARHRLTLFRGAVGIARRGSPA